MYEIQVRHDGLNKFRLIKGNDKWVVEEKARFQKAAWDELWDRRRSASQKQTLLYNLKEQAADLTSKAGKGREVLGNLLRDSLNIPPTSWDVMKSSPPFQETKPTAPALKVYSPKPDPSSSEFIPTLNFIERNFPAFAKLKLEAAQQRFATAVSRWNAECEAVDAVNRQAKVSHTSDLSAWKARLEEHNNRMIEEHALIDDKAQRYRMGDPASIIDFIDLVLSESPYPDYFPDDWDIDYIADSRTALVEFRLPSLDDLPSNKETKFIASRNVVEDVQLKPAVLNTMYDSLVYQICLRTLHEIFSSDEANVIDYAAFNGWVQYVDRSSGHETRACIMSVHTSKEVFKAINLAAIDPKACFRSLKGVGSSQLHAMAAVAPILKLNREDKRFIFSVDVESSLDEGTNLAAISWQDFEYLIRQVFEREFSSSGSEVKVTQASRDGGVDAIAFDPDPIRGGKIVIQAKRYTNTVGVSAVRDLYGTVMNEGATKGILVSTSSYRPDAYSFAKDKPLTLLDGSNLLHLMGKHGHNVRIDLAEAKRMAQ